MNTISTASNNFSLYFQDGKEVFPCRCGEIHENKEDWMKHQCFHDRVCRHDQIEGLGFCTQCGKLIELF